MLDGEGLEELPLPDADDDLVGSSRMLFCAVEACDARSTCVMMPLERNRLRLASCCCAFPL